ncbi:MAG: NAD(P)/FAD-dependent oxidoreductase, partial [Pseudomonadota bacterium]
MPDRRRPGTGSVTGLARYNRAVATEPRAPWTVDVAVIGGGPAGSATAALLAQDGRSVALFEKASHPRFHIGESMLPNSLPILERLGVLEDVRAIGLRKDGADFTCEAPGYHREPQATQLQTFRFARALGDVPDHAFEVRRADFDALLFRNAAAAGATLFEGCEVVDVEHACAVQILTYRGPDACTRELTASFVVDASGRSALLARRNGWIERNPQHASAAVFAHFTGVPRRPGSDGGNISIYWFEHGWIWMIPLNDPQHGAVMSIGAVCRPDYLRAQRSAGADPETILEAALKLSPAAAERTAAAQRLTPVHSEGNYSYRSRRACAPGQHLIGDAYGFIDPVFSS